MKHKMKNLILALSFVSLNANAEAIMWTSNTDGGKIVLTDELCSGNKAMIAYITGQKGETITGCWTNDSVSIHVMWSGKYLKSYDYTGWTIVKKDSTL